jgi:hypothetical protein
MSMKQLAAAIALSWGALAAQAATMSIKFLGVNSQNPTLTTTETSNYATGALSYLDSVNGSFTAFCIEPSAPNAPTSAGFKTYTIDSFVGTQATLLQGLYSSTFSGLSTKNDNAAFQLAVWEIVREASSPVLDVSQGAGSFYVKTDGLSGASLQSANDLIAQANSYLATAQTYNGPALYTLTKLTNGAYQDLVVAQPVPEAQTYAMFLAGLGVIGFVARRRQRR